jgi:hypothetical protein
MSRFGLLCVSLVVATANTLPIWEVAKRETLRNPVLRKRDRERKNTLKSRLAQLTVEKGRRVLQNQQYYSSYSGGYNNAYGANNNGYGNGYNNANAYNNANYQNNNGYGNSNNYNNANAQQYSGGYGNGYNNANAQNNNYNNANQQQSNNDGGYGNAQQQQNSNNNIYAYNGNSFNNNNETDYYFVNSSAQYQWNEDLQEGDFGFDITNYAIKYTQCATVQTYSEALAQGDETTVLGTCRVNLSWSLLDETLAYCSPFFQSCFPSHVDFLHRFSICFLPTTTADQRFAIFRLCPKAQCSSDNVKGCKKNFGEYVVSLDQFLVAMLDYQEYRVFGYCDFCQECARIEAYKSFWKSVYSMRDYVVEEADVAYQNWYTNYLETANSYSSGYSNNYAKADLSLAPQTYYLQMKKARSSSSSSTSSGGNGQYSQQSGYTNANSGNNDYFSSSYGYSNRNDNGGNGNNYYGQSNAYGSNGYGQYAPQYRWRSEEMWKFQSNQQNKYASQSWANAGIPQGSFFGKAVVNGFYNEDGTFEQVYGYINAQGYFVSLEEEYLGWDAGLWGEMPDGWDELDVDVASCSYTDASSCYNQYDACMEVLGDQDYQMYQAYQQGATGSVAYTSKETQDMYNIKDFLSCKEVRNYGNGQYSTQSQYYAEQQVYHYNQRTYETKRYYIGPKCGADGHEIALAVYSDPYCAVQYTTITPETLLGYNPLDSSFELFPDECVSCLDEDVSAIT